MGAQPLADVCSNAKKMQRSEGTWVAPDTRIAEISVGRTAPAQAGMTGDEHASEAVASSAAQQASEPDQQPDSGAGEAATFVCTAGVHGKVLCMNTRLIDEPAALWRRPHDEGYLMIVAMHTARHKELQQSMDGLEAVAAARGVEQESLRACAVFDLQQYVHLGASAGT